MLRTCLLLVSCASIASCVTVENNAGGESGAFGGGADDGSGDPTQCQSACQTARDVCPLDETLPVSECTSECVQTAPPAGVIACVSTASSCDDVYDCVDSGGGGGGGESCSSGWAGTYSLRFDQAASHPDCFDPGPANVTITQNGCDVTILSAGSSISGVLEGDTMTTELIVEGQLVPFTATFATAAGTDTVRTFVEVFPGSTCVSQGSRI